MYTLLLSNIAHFNKMLSTIKVISDIKLILKYFNNFQ